MKNFEEVINMLESNDDLCDFVGSISDDVIEKAEKILGYNFPETYRAYLSKYGAGNFGAQEVYGIISSDFENSGIPDAIWLTMKEREDNDLPNDLLVIYYSGDEFYYCLDTSKSKDNECPVVSVAIDDLSGDRTIVNSSFSEFLLDIFSTEI